MAILGAKPNHAFFHCQHPSQKKIPQRGSAPHRSNRRWPHIYRSADRNDHARQLTRKKQNIFFPAVFFAAYIANRAPLPVADDDGGARPEYVRARERIAFGIASSGQFFVLHKADCAKVRELLDASRAVEAA
jgi:hypothetical protein